MKRRRFIIGMVVISCTVACLFLLWNEMLSEFWTVVLGAAYLYFDRIEEKKKEDES